MKRINKSGQQMTLGTIIAIVLGIVVLVLLVWGFSTGWNNMWNKVTSYGAGSDNTGTIVQSCALKCSTGNHYGFCNQLMDVKTGDGYENNSVTCNELSSGEVSFTKKGGSTSTPLTIGVEPCSSLCD